MRVLAVLFASFALLAGVGVFAARRSLEATLTKPLDPGGAAQLFEVHPGENTASLVRRLQDAGLVRPGPLLVTYAERLRAGAPPVSGEYRLNPGFTPLQILDRIEAGLRYEHTVTLRPGATLEQNARLLAKRRLADRDAFLAAARDPEVLRRLGIPGPSAEGFLFPDVWSLPRGLRPEALLGRLVDRFRRQTPNLSAAAERLGFTPYELVILASLVEKGPIPPAERRLYAALLIERAQHGYALESAAADDYGRSRPGAPADPREDPWNTTARVGLPLTPIGSPGPAALAAVADPAHTEPLFMIRRGGGRHVYCPDVACLRTAYRQHQPGQVPPRPLRAPRR